MPLRALTFACGAALLAQISLGAWVSTNYAVLACADFPSCHGAWWPAMNFSQGFELWRELGVTGRGEPIEFAALTAIHFTHRLVALPVVLMLLWLAAALYAAGPLRKPALALAALTTFQVLTGVSNVVFEWPLLAAVLHTGGAGAMVLVLTWIWCASEMTRTGEMQPSQNAIAARPR